MSSTRRSRIAAFVAVATLTMGALTACAATAPDGTSGELTLNAIKSPTQLLRNEAAGRIDGKNVDSIVQPTDKSTPCKPSADDPDELYRTWQSGVLTLIKTNSSKTVKELSADLVDSFTTQGWTLGTAAATKSVRLEKNTTFATIDISYVENDLVNDVPGQIQVLTAGPCVLTGGPDSAEVKKLEGKD